MKEATEIVITLKKRHMGQHHNTKHVIPYTNILNDPRTTEQLLVFYQHYNHNCWSIRVH